MRAHARGPLQDRLFQRAAGAVIDVVLAERALGRRHLGDRLRERSLTRFAAVENAGLVEVNVGLDKAGNDEPAGEIFLSRVGVDARGNLDDTPAANTDVDTLQLPCRRCAHGAGRSREPCSEPSASSECAACHTELNRTNRRRELSAAIAKCRSNPHRDRRGQARPRCAPPPPARRLAGAEPGEIDNVQHRRCSKRPQRCKGRAAAAMRVA